MFLARALAAEQLKLKRTLALNMCFIAPLVVVSLATFIILAALHRGTTPQDAEQIWIGFARNTCALWAMLMLPLFVTLESALMAQLEYGNAQWKHLFALPIPERAHLDAKFIALAALTGIATMVLMLLICVAGIGLAWAGLMPAAWPLPLDWMLARFAEMMIGSFAMLAIHHWVAMRWGNFTVAIAFGITAALVTFLMTQSTNGHWLPWAWAAQPVSPKRDHMAFSLIVSAVTGTLVLLLGQIDLVRNARK